MSELALSELAACQGRVARLCVHPDQPCALKNLAVRFALQVGTFPRIYVNDTTVDHKVGARALSSFWWTRLSFPRSPLYTCCRPQPAPPPHARRLLSCRLPSLCTQAGATTRVEAIRAYEGHGKEDHLEFPKGAKIFVVGKDADGQVRLALPRSLSTCQRTAQPRNWYRSPPPPARSPALERRVCREAGQGARHPRPRCLSQEARRCARRAQVQGHQDPRQRGPGPPELQDRHDGLCPQGKIR